MKNTKKTYCNYHLLLVSTLFLLAFQPAKALEYTFHFVPSADTVSIDSVFVENVTHQQTIRIAGGEVLILTDQPVGLNDIDVEKAERLSIFSNPSMDGSATISFQSAAPQVAQLAVLNLAGQPVISKKITLKNGLNGFTLSNVPAGMNFVVLTAGNRRYSGKLISNAPERGSIRLSETDGEAVSAQMGTKPHQVQETQQERYMHFEPGDRLKLTGLAGVDKSVRVVSPVSDSIVSFSFYRCVDGDGISYPTVVIGHQVWMAENLRTTRYNNGSPIYKITDSEQWASMEAYEGAYGWYENDSLNRLPYGALYNGFAVMDTRLAPKGWHVATDNDFGTLVGAVTINQQHLIAGDTTYWNDLPVTAYDSTGFGAVGAGLFGYGSYNSRFEYAAFWTSTEGEMPSAPKRRESNQALASRYYKPYLFNLFVQPQCMYTNMNAADNGLSVRCVRNQAPTVTTGKVHAGRATKAGVEGEIISNGGEDIQEYGFCWSWTNKEPNLKDSVVVAGEAVQNTFGATLSGLKTGVMYYVRAYAKNSMGVSYGDVKIFETIDAGTVTDIDENVYSTVKIGEQVWMAENLKVSRYNDGTLIPLVNTPQTWSMLSTGARCLNDTLAPVNEYGYLYNHRAVQSNKLAPVGWHVPSQTEYLTLLDSLSTTNQTEDMLLSRLKEAGAAHWLFDYANGTNISGFTALPGGYRSSTGEVFNIGAVAMWWTVSKGPDENNASYYNLRIEPYSVYTDQSDLNNGLSVRCLKDYPAKLNTCLKDVSQTKASIGIKLIETGGVLTRSGLCFSMTSAQPDVNNAQVILIDSLELKGEDWLNLDTLTSGATYYLRAFAENSTGVSYGEVVTFSTPSSNTVEDLDGNQYHTIKIGTQTWMVENLKTTKYNDGTSIGGISGYHSTSPGYTMYGDNSITEIYGLLYNWYAVNTGKLAPTGWRVPTQEDWQTLVEYLGGEEVAGGKLKESGFSHWNDPNTGAIDWGFKALPGGTRDGTSATFRTLRDRGWWWASTPGIEDYNAYMFGLVSWMSSGYIGQGYKSDAYSVRCIKEE